MKQEKKAVCTIAMIVINITIFLVLSFQGMTEDGIFMFHHGAMYVPSMLEDGEYYRLFTSMFLHFGFDDEYVHIGCDRMESRIRNRKMEIPGSLSVKWTYGESAVCVDGHTDRGICYFCRGVRGNLWGDWGIILCSASKQRTNWKYQQQRTCIYGSMQSLLRFYK